MAAEDLEAAKPEMSTCQKILCIFLSWPVGSPLGPVLKVCSNVCWGNILGRGNSPGYEVIMAWLWPRLDGCIPSFIMELFLADFQEAKKTWCLTCAAWEAREEQVFIQARSLATWSAVLGVYLVMSGFN